MAFEISHYTQLLCQVSAKSVDHNFWPLEQCLRQWHLSDLIEKQKGYRNVENTSDNESNHEESSSDIENQEKEEEVASENGVKAEGTKRATTTLRTTVRKQKVVALKRPPPFTLKVPVNIAKTLMCTRHWSWNVLNAFGTITTRFVLYAITRSPRRENTSKRAFFGVTIVD